MTGDETARAIESADRTDFGRLIAGLALHTGDIGLAEELAQDVQVVAVEQWPESGGKGPSEALEPVQQRPLRKPLGGWC